MFPASALLFPECHLCYHYQTILLKFVLCMGSHRACVTLYEPFSWQWGHSTHTLVGLLKNISQNAGNINSFLYKVQIIIHDRFFNRNVRIYVWNQIFAYLFSNFSSFDICQSREFCKVLFHKVNTWNRFPFFFHVLNKLYTFSILPPSMSWNINHFMYSKSTL